MENRISSQQVAFLTFLLLLGSAFVFVPESSAGRNAWVSSILSALIGFFALAIILRLQLMFPGVSIFKIAELSLGLVPGKILNSIYLFIVWVVALLYLADIISLLRQLFPLLPAYSLRVIIILTAAYCLYKGVTSIAYLAELVIGFIIFFLVIGFLAPLSLADFSNLQPVLSEWYAMAGAVLYGAAWPYLEITVFALLLPMVNDLEKGYPKIVTWFMIAAVVLILRTVLVLAVLGPELTLAYAFPFYKVFRLVEVQNFQLAFLTFLLLLGSAFVFVPESSAGRNAWVSSILSALIGFFALAIILRLQLMFPGVSIFKIAELSLGLVPGKILNSIYLFIVWVVALLYLADIISLLRQLFPLLPAYSLRVIIILTAAYCLYRGVTSIAYLAELVIGFIIFFLVIGFLAPLSLADFSNLQPVLSEWYAMV
jgi:spore germination protein KB